MTWLEEVSVEEKGRSLVAWWASESLFLGMTQMTSKA